MIAELSNGSPMTKRYKHIQKQIRGMWYPYEETPVHAVIFLDFAGDLWAMPARQISFLCINIQKLVFVVILTNGRKFTGKKSSRCHNIHNFRACSRIMVQTNKKSDINLPFFKLAVLHWERAKNFAHGNLCTHRSWPSPRTTLRPSPLASQWQKGGLQPTVTPPPQP